MEQCGDNKPIKNKPTHPSSVLLLLSPRSDGQVAFLQQSDHFFSMLTTRETLELASFLEVPHVSRKVRSMKVDSTLDALGLRHVAHRAIGDSSAGSGGPRLSGGEKRRLSVGVELMTASTLHLFLADEATTGLDSFQATKMVRLISKLAKEQHIAAICSLHQPRTSIWKQLDSIVLLSPGGRVCYAGKRKTIVEYFAGLGHECPLETNPAEFLLDLVSVDTEDAQQAMKDRARIDKLAKAFQESQRNPTDEQPSSSDMHSPVLALSTINHGSSSKGQQGKLSPTIQHSSSSGGGFQFRPFVPFRRFGALLKRSWRQNIRNGPYNFFRLLASVGNALLFSQIFKSVQKGAPDAKSLADRVALLSFGVINMSMVSPTRLERERERVEEYLCDTCIPDCAFAIVDRTLIGVSLCHFPSLILLLDGTNKGIASLWRRATRCESRTDPSTIFGFGIPTGQGRRRNPVGHGVFGRLHNDTQGCHWCPDWLGTTHGCLFSHDSRRGIVRICDCGLVEKG